jgi:hypothetical protein
MQPAELLGDPEAGSSPFRTAFGRARIEALTATSQLREPRDRTSANDADFEYRLLKRKGKRSAEEACWNALGREGWELVAVTRRHAAFKRRL